VFHDLRHSYCSWAVDVWPVPDVKAFAGHRDISTTMKYVHRTAKATHATMADEALRTMLASAGDAAGLTTCTPAAATSAPSTASCSTPATTCAAN
jgi:hypothetical protein